MEHYRLCGQNVALTLGYMILILMTSIIPMDRDIEGLRFAIGLKPIIQNLLHIPMFAILAILWLRLFGTYQIKGRKRIMLVLFFSTSFGILIEIMQLAVPGRCTGIVDIGLNITGVLIGILLYVLLEKSRLDLFRRIICS